MDESVVNVRLGTPLDISKASKRNLVLLHEEQRRLKGVMEQLQRSCLMVKCARGGMEAVLGLECHEWDLDNDYDPDDPPEKREEENPLRHLFGG